jgi:hypothetical protein
MASGSDSGEGRQPLRGEHLAGTPWLDLNAKQLSP